MAAKSDSLKSRSYSQKVISTRPPSGRSSILSRFWLPAVVGLALAAGGLTGIVAAYELNYSRAANEVAALATYRPSVVTRVYADDVTTGTHEGGSTLTQQLAKNLFLSKEQTIKRKVNEWALALQIERYYTKNQIMELYVNHMFLGANAYGMEAGAETYFGKKAKDLNVGEAALLAAIPKAPSEYSPLNNPAKAKERRDLVLDLMAKNGFASEGEVDAAKGKPIQLADTAYYQAQTKSTPFDYPVELIRQ